MVDNMDKLTEMIRISKELKEHLDDLKIVGRETYDSVIRRNLKKGKTGGRLK